MRNFQTITFVILLILIGSSCTSIKDQQFKEQYLPDLKINHVEYSINQHEIVAEGPEQPQITLMGLIDIELLIYIENIGSGNWNSDVCILYILDEGRRQDHRVLLFEKLKVPYASKRAILVVLKDLVGRPHTITINLNPPDLDSVECNRFSEENFYNNNLYVLNLHKRRPN